MTLRLSPHKSKTILEKEQCLLRKHKEVKRKEVIFDPEEFKQVEQLAKKAGVTTSEYIRRMALNGKFVKINMGDVMPLVNAIRPIGNNVNQIARMVNETHSIYAEDIEKLRENYQSLCRILNQYVSTLPSIVA